MKSAMTGGYAENTGMGSLRDRHARLSKHVPRVAPEDVIHVTGGCFCPVLSLYGVPRIHSSNGVYVALQRREGGGGEVEAVYASCPNCEFERKNMSKDRMVDIVPGLEDSTHPWVRYTEDTYASMAAAASTNPAPPPPPTLKKKSHSSSSSTTRQDGDTSSTTTTTHPAQARKKLKTTSK